MNRTFFCFSIARSGHHAVMNWLRSHMSTAVWTKQKKKRIKVISFPETGYVQGAKITRDKTLCPKTTRRLKRETENFTNVFVNAENQHLILDFDTVSLPKEQIYSILILRDPFNNVASLAQHYNRLKNSENLGERRFAMRGANHQEFGIKLWERQAKEFLGQTNLLPNKILINFNLWFSSEEYRNSISEQIGGTPDDGVLNYVPAQGNGSSFDDFDFQRKAQEMGVFKRWRKDEYDTKKLFNKKVIALAREIFGDDFVNPIIESWN